MLDSNNLKIQRKIGRVIRRLRVQRWFGVSILMLCLAAAMIATAAWGESTYFFGSALILVLLAAAVLAPSVWVTYRWFHYIAAAVLLGALSLSELTTLLPIRLSPQSAVIAMIGIWLIHKLANQSPGFGRNTETDFERKLADSSIHKSSLFDQALRLELVRSRRHERPFCLVILRFSKPISHLTRSDFGKLSHILNSSLRWIDLVYQGSNKNQLMLICPETTLAGILPFTERIYEQISLVFPGTISIGWASFPAESLTSHELITEARRKLSQIKAPDKLKMVSDTSIKSLHDDADLKKVNSRGKSDV